MQTWTLDRRPEALTDLPVDLIKMEDWPYYEHYNYALKKVLEECQGGMPGTLRFIVPISQNTFYMDSRSEDSYTAWINALFRMQKEQKIISIAVGNDGKSIVLIKMTAEEHLSANPSLNQIEELYKLYHHHLT